MNLSVLTESQNIAPRFESANTEHSSFLIECLSALSENRNIRLQIQQDFYRNILEAGDNTALIMEASEGFIGGVKNIIDKFIALIKKLFTKFVTTLKSIVKSDKYLKKNKDKLMNFDGSNEFEMEIFKYTNLDNDTFPNLHAYRVYKTNDFSKANQSTELDLKQYTAAVYTNFKDGLEDWYNKFRGMVLTDSTDTGVQSYTSSEFANELREKFRGGESSKSKETITAFHVREAYDRFANYEKTIDHISKMKRDMEKEYEMIKNDFKKLPTAYSDVTSDEYFTKVNAINSELIDSAGDNVWYDKNHDKTGKYITDEKFRKEVDANITSFIKAKMDQVDTMCSIHAMAFSAKLDACKEAYKQDKALLYRALKKINKTYDFSNKN